MCINLGICSSKMTSLPVKYFSDKIFPVISLVEDAVLNLSTPAVHADFLPVMKLETRALTGASLTWG